MIGLFALSRPVVLQRFQEIVIVLPASRGLSGMVVLPSARGMPRRSGISWPTAGSPAKPASSRKQQAASRQDSLVHFVLPPYLPPISTASAA